jgi:hypothetical protein
MIVCVLLIALTADATTKIKIVNKTDKTISVELFKVIGENQGLKLERIKKATFAKNDSFSEDKLSAKQTYMVKIMSDSALLKQLIKNTTGKLKENKKIDLEKLDNQISDKEHYFIIPALSDKQVVHINFKFDQDVPDVEHYEMRKTKNNINAEALQYGTFLNDTEISSTFNQALLQTKICFISDEKINEVFCFTSQLLAEVKEQILEEIGKSEDEELDDSHEFDDRNTDTIQFSRKASMKLLLQDTFIVKDTTNYNQVLLELNQKTQLRKKD